MDTDTQVCEDIVAEFKNIPVLRYPQPHLHVQDGVVTISGRVSSLAERKAVERAAKRVAGAAAIPMTVTDISVDSQKQFAS